MPCKTGLIAVALPAFAAHAVGAPPADLAMVVAVARVPRPITVQHAGESVGIRARLAPIAPGLP